MAQTLCTMCGGTGLSSVNFAKPVAAPAQQYGTILGDAPQRDEFKRGARGNRPPAGGVGRVMHSSPLGSSQTQQQSLLPVIQVPWNAYSSGMKFVYESSPPPPPSKDWSSLVPQKSFCLPICGGGPSSNNCQSFVFCFPPQPPPEEPKPAKPEEELKPIGYISRNKDVDFIGGKLIGGCICGRRNGLSGSCPRISCRDNPGCTMNPPRCWPAFKLPDPPPPPPPDQKMVCIPIQLVYGDKTPEEPSGCCSSK